MVKRFRPGSYEYIIRFRFRFDGSVNTRYHVLKGISNYTGNKTGNISHASSRQINSPNKFVTLSIRSTISWSRLPSIQQFHFVYTSYKISTRSKNKTNNTRPIDRENPSLTVLSRFSLPLDLLPPWLHRRYPICGRGNNHASIAFTANWSHALRSCCSRGSTQPRKPKRAGSICVWRQTPYNRSARYIRTTNFLLFPSLLPLPPLFVSRFFRGFTFGSRCLAVALARLTGPEGPRKT